MSAEQDRLIRQQISGLLYGGDPVGAESLCQEHLKRKPRDHEALAMLAHILLTTGRYREAEATLSKAIAKDSKRADYQALMAEILTTTGRHREALARYDRSLKIKPDFEAALAGKCETYLRMGKPDKTIKVIESTAGGSHASPLLAIVHGRALIRSGDAPQAEQIVRRHLPGDGINIEHRRSLWFVAALAAEKQGQFDQAAELYDQANAVVNAEWHVEQAMNHRQRVEEVFKEKGYPSLPRSECDDESMIFIVGMLRSGSTLTEQIIDAHPQAAGLGELDAMSILVQAMPEVLGTALPYPACLEETNELGLTSMAGAYLDQVKAMAPKAVRRVDKQLGNFTFLGLISLLFPKARVIHCQRHPMDTGLSCWTQKFAPGTNEWATSQKAVGAFYREQEAWMERWKEIIPLPVLNVFYEDLVDDLEAQSRRIIEFCGLDWDDRCLRFWESGRTVLTLSSDQVRQPIYQRSARRHEAWGDSLATLRNALGDAVDRYEAQAGP